MGKQSNNYYHRCFYIEVIGFKVLLKHYFTAVKYSII